jgi:hypothetical protein
MTGILIDKKCLALFSVFVLLFFYENENVLSLRSLYIVVHIIKDTFFIIIITFLPTALNIDTSQWQWPLKRAVLSGLGGPRTNSLNCNDRRQHFSCKKNQNSSDITI